MKTKTLLNTTEVHSQALEKITRHRLEMTFDVPTEPNLETPIQSNIQVYYERDGDGCGLITDIELDNGVIVSEYDLDDMESLMSVFDGALSNYLQSLLPSNCRLVDKEWECFFDDLVEFIENETGCDF